MVPWESSAPKTSAPVSVCVSKCTRPTGPCAATQARTSGSVIEWSPPRITGMAPAASTCPTVSWMAAWERTGSAGRMGASPKSTTRSSASASTLDSSCGPGGQLAALMARGAKRVPGRSETSSSVGAPTIATSAPSEVRRVLRVGTRRRRTGVPRNRVSHRYRPNVVADLSSSPLPAACREGCGSVRCSWAARRARGCGRRSPAGLSQKETVSTGMTGHSSGRVMWWMPNTYHSTTSVFSMGRFCCVQPRQARVFLALVDELTAGPALVLAERRHPERMPDHPGPLQHGRRGVEHRGKTTAGHELVGGGRAQPVSRVVVDDLPGTLGLQS